jgi:hypothetical protein
MNPALAALVSLCLLATPAGAGTHGTGPTYADRKTERLVEKMLAAHGGLDAFRDAPSIRYEHEMLDPGNPADPWVSHEVHEPGSRRTYHEWPGDEARIGFDGTSVWSVGWKRQNPPSMMSGVSFFFLFLPWITQDDGVHLEAGPRQRVEAIDEKRSLLTVRMTFEGASEHEYYELYVDPKTYLLAGVEYTVTSPAMLRLFGAEEQGYLGPLLKVYARHVEAGGLVLPERYDTWTGGRRYGMHFARAYALDQPFEEARARAPEGAVLDRSESVRR